MKRRTLRGVRLVSRLVLLDGLLSLSLMACGGQVRGTAQDEVSSSVLTERDLAQEADLADATTIALVSGKDVSITEEGIFLLRGTATDVTVTVDVGSSAKVQLVLDGISITNADAPAIYVASADKVFVTTTQGSSNALAVTGAFHAEGETDTDSVIYSKDDLVLNGLGTLSISSTDNGISCKDDLKVTGGAYVVECASDAIEVNDNLYVAGGELRITAGSDGIQAKAHAQVDGGALTIGAEEGIESTDVLIQGGALRIEATDDGINAAQKVDVGMPTIRIAGGEVYIKMAQGDTDALDSNGDLYISGGVVDIIGQSAFDYDGEGQLTGGTVSVNGEQVSELRNSSTHGASVGEGRTV